MSTSSVPTTYPPARFIESLGDYLTVDEHAEYVAGVSSVAEFVNRLLLGIVVLFYFLEDGDSIWELMLKPFRGSTLARGHRVGVTSVEVLGSNVRGTAVVGLVDATVIGLSLAILQVPLALPLSVIVSSERSSRSSARPSPERSRPSSP